VRRGEARRVDRRKSDDKMMENVRWAIREASHCSLSSLSLFVTMVENSKPCGAKALEFCCRAAQHSLCKTNISPTGKDT